jgi:hypothetical protein
LYYISNAQAQATVRLFTNAVYELTGEVVPGGQQQSQLQQGQLQQQLRPPHPPPPPWPSARDATHTGDASLDMFQKLVSWENDASLPAAELTEET